MSSVRHYPWDGGALHTVRMIVGQRTIKAYCDRRVLVDQVDAAKPITCPECCQRMREHAEGIELLLEHHPGARHAAGLRKLAADLRALAVA